jgi:(2R)-3-sulfolactate dehydrogenase (NADP+)
MLSDTPTLSLADIEALVTSALIAAGTSERNAAPLARAVAQAERDGIASHGLMYVPTYCAHVRCGKVSGVATPLMTKTRAGVIVVDAQTGFAHPAIELGFSALIPLARELGIACLAINQSYNCGVLGTHVERLAEAGLLGLGFTNAPASIAPTGGKRPVVGTNPFALGVPGPHGAILVIDQSASVVAKSELMKRVRRNEPIPEGWALDNEGHPTTDPAAATAGTMAPSGGYKGVGLGLLTEIMAAALTGATLGIDAAPFSGDAGGPPRTGQFFIAIAPEATSGGLFASRMSALAAAFAAQPGARLPGSRRVAARNRADRDGIAVDPDILVKIQALATLPR